MPGHRGAVAGFTLLEVVVVLILLGIASAVVAPSLLVRPSPASAEAMMQALVRNAREAAIRRGEMVRLTVHRSGEWQATAGTPPTRELLMSGRLTRPPVLPADLLFSPLGTCAPSIQSDGGAPFGAFDSLTCESPPP
ncbi:MAG: prepilin-type N-terminal cleavage/methylation domain-containing protein [Gemmatimonadales bacterium]